MCLNQKYILENIIHEEQIKLQYQAAKNLCYFLLRKIALIEDLHQHILKEKFYFLFSQPILSSILLLGILKFSGQYSDKNMEDLFITSIFKDLGMSIVPINALNKKVLNSNEVEAFLAHPEFSQAIVKLYLPLSHKYLNIIKHHHIYSLLDKTDNIIQFSHEKFKRNHPQETDSKNQEIILGTETLFVCLSDMLAAMIAPRPYRAAISLYESLKIIKPLIATKYPMEFQLIIKYFNKYFQLSSSKK